MLVSRFRGVLAVSPQVATRKGGAAPPTGPSSALFGNQWLELTAGLPFIPLWTGSIG